MGNVLILNEENFAEVTSQGVVVVDFYADWCAPCRKMAPRFEEAKARYEGRAVLAKVNTDENRSIVASHGIRGIPTLIFFKDGEIADRVTGEIDESTLDEKINALL